MKSSHISLFAVFSRLVLACAVLFLSGAQTALRGQTGGLESEGPSAVPRFFDPRVRVSVMSAEVVGLCYPAGVFGCPAVSGALVLLPSAVDRDARAALAAAAVVSMGQPAGSLNLLAAGQARRLWSSQAQASAVSPVSKSRAKAAKLDLSVWDIEDKTPIPSWQENYSEAMAYVRTLVVAHDTSLEAFAAGAQRDLTFAHFWEEPKKYRGEVVRLEGTLTRVRRFDPPPTAQREGVRNLYEGWICDPKIHGANFMCIIFTELPPGLEVAEKMKQPVVFYGYFFKIYRYKAADGHARAAPLLIGHMPEIPRSLTPVNSNNVMLVILFLGCVAGTVVLAVALAIWYSQGDKKIRARLTDASAARFIDSTANFEKSLELEPPGTAPEPEDGAQDDRMTG